MKIKKKIALLTVFIILFNLFSPYAGLFQNYSYASSGTITDDDMPIAFTALEVKTIGANKVLRVQLAYVTEEPVYGCDIHFKIDTSKIKPCNKTTGAPINNMALVLEQSGYYAGTIQVKTYNASTNEFIITCTEGATPFSIADDLGYVPGAMGDPEIDDRTEFPVYYPIATLNFKLLDSSVNSVSDVNFDDYFALSPNGALPYGVAVVYRNGGGAKVTKQTPKVATSGFKEAAGPEVTGITVTQDPTNTTYNHGDTISLAGGKIEVTYNNDPSTATEIAMDSPGVSIKTPADGKANVNNPVVTIEYEGKTATFNTTVNDPIDSLKVVGSLATGNYNQDDPIDFSGITLKAVKRSGAEVSLTPTSAGVTASETVADVNSPTFQAFDPTETPVRGTQNITFSYQVAGMATPVSTTTPISIIVNDTVTGISLTSQPDTQVYRRGESLDLTGATVSLTLASGHAPITLSLPDASVQVGTYNPATTGSKQHLSVSYGAFTADDTIDVEAYNYITGATFTAPTDTSPEYNTELNQAGGKFQFTWHGSGGTPAVVNMPNASVQISGYTKTDLNEQTVTATYSGNYVLSDGTQIPYSFSEDFTVIVYDKPTAVNITKPSKETYQHGESIDFTGSQIEVVHASGAKTYPAMTEDMLKENGAAISMAPTAAEYAANNHKVSKTFVISYTEDAASGSVNYPIDIINPVTGMAIQGTPKTTYNVNEGLDPNLKVTITREVGNPEDKTVTAAMIPDFTTTSEGVYSPDITYTENGITKTVTYDYTVVDSVSSISIYAAPPVNQKVDGTLDLTGGKISVVKGSGTTQVDINASMIKAGTYNSANLGDQTVTVEYGGKETTFPVKVLDYVTGITVSPAEVEGNYNDELADLITAKNIQYTVNYKRGTATTTSLNAGMVAGYNKQTTAAQNLTVTYTDNNDASYTKGDDFTADLQITLNPVVTGIVITVPSTTEYSHGDSLVADGTITVSFNDGTNANRTMTTAMIKEGANAVNMSPSSYGETQKVTKTLTITYTEGTVTKTLDYTIDIINPIEKIELYGTPKTAYNVNEGLDTNLEILVTRKAGTPEAKTVTAAMVPDFATTTEGSYSPDISYTENGITKTVAYGYTVADSVTDISIFVAPPVNQKVDGTLDLTGGKISVVKGSGTTQVNINASMIKAGTYNSSNLGDQTVTVTYGGKETTFPVKVLDYVTGITVSPAEVEGNYDDELSSIITAKNIQYTVNYKKGTPTTTALGAGMVAGYNKQTTAAQNLTVTYTDNNDASYTKGDDFTANLQITLNPVVTGIVITAPSTTEYKHGDSLVPDGTITVSYNGASPKNVTMTTAMIKEGANPVNMSPSSYGETQKVTKTLTITYTEGTVTKTLDYTIDIINPIEKIELYGTPKTAYNVNESLDTNLEILVTRKAGTPETKTVTAAMVPDFATTTEGSYSPDISYTENGITKTVAYGYTVADSVTDISIYAAPPVNQKVDGTLDLTGGKISVVKGSGTTQIDITAAMIKAGTYNSSNLGDQTVTVTYGGKETTFPVKVLDYVTGITVSPAEVEGNYDDELADLITNKNIQYTVNYKKGTPTTTVLSAGMVAGYNKQTTEEQNLVVTYTDNNDASYTKGDDFTADLKVTLGKVVTAITITAPTTTEYTHGDSLVADGTINVVFNDGTNANRTMTVDMIKEGANPVNMSPSSYGEAQKVTKTLTITYTEGTKTETLDYTIDIINPIEKIELYGTPKTSYNLNEGLDTNLEILVTRKVGTPETKTVTAAMVPDFATTSEGSHTVDISYTENGITKTVAYGYTVADSVTDISIYAAPLVNQKVDGTLDLTGGKISVVKGSGTTQIDITAAMIKAGTYNSSNLGDQTVTVTYGGKETTFPVKVLDYVTGITVSPAEVEGNYDDELADLITNKNIQYTVNYKKGTPTTTALNAGMVAGYNKQTTEEQNLVVTYQDKDNNSYTKDEEFTTNLKITLGKVVTAITITAPTTTEYTHGDSLVADGTITVSFNDGTNANRTMTVDMIKEGSDAVNMSPSSYGEAQKVTKTLTITYTEGTVTKTLNYTIDIINPIESIELHGTPKTSYNLNEGLDTNLEILVTRKAGTPEAKTVTAAMVPDFATSSEGSHTVDISYTENGITKTVAYGYTVADSVTDISIFAAPPVKQKYGEAIDLTGGKISVVKGSGTTQIDLTAAMIKSGTFSNTTLGDQTVTVTYGGKETTFPVKVLDYVTGITVSPAEVEGNYNDELADLITTKNIQYTVNYKKGTPTTTTLSEGMVAGYNKQTTEEQNLVVTYTDNNDASYSKGDDFTTNLKITLSKVVTGITITAPETTEYQHGDTLIPDGTITVSFNDGTSTNRTMTVDMIKEGSNAVNMTPVASSYGEAQKVTKTLTIRYTEGSMSKTLDYTIDIINPIESIELHGTPKTSYNQNEGLDSNLEILVRRKVGTPEAKTVTAAMVPDFATTTEGSYSADISYTENGITKTVAYGYTVADSVTDISIFAAPPEKQKYGEAIDLTGGKISVVKGSGTTQIDLTAAMIKSGTFSNTTLGDQTVTVTYGGKETTFPVKVLDYVTGIAVNPEVITGEYNNTLGQLITTNSITYTVTYKKAGAGAPITLSQDMVAGYSQTSTDVQNLVVTYQDKDNNSYTKDEAFTTNLQITLGDEVTGITLIPPTNTEYGYGDTFDKADGGIQVTKSSGPAGSLTFNSPGVSVTETDGSALDLTNVTFGADHKATKTVKVSYGGQSETFTITVINKITGIEMKNLPKTSYRVGDSLDKTINGTTPGTIEVTRQNNSKETINLTDANVDVTGFDSSEENTSLSIQVSYTENGITKDTSYPVSITDEVQNVQIESMPKTVYKYGESLDLSTGKLKVTKDSGEKIIDMKPSMITELDGTAFDNTKLGTRNINITYGGIVIPIEVTVNDYVLGIILTPPTKTTYEYGEELSLAGGSVQKVMASGADTTPVSLSDAAVTLTTFDKTHVGAQTIQVTYEGKTESFGVNVYDNIQTIEMVSTPKTTYKFGESLNVTGGTIEATRSSHTKEIVSITPNMVTGFNPNQLGAQTLTVTYGDKTTTYPIHVEDYVTGIELVAPDKQVYKIGETLDLTGGQVRPVMASGAATTPVAMTNADVTVSTLDTSKEGAKIITVSYQGLKNTFGVTVVDPLSSMVIKTLPNKQTYRYGESLDLTGGTIEIEKESGAKQVLNITNAMVSGYNPKKLGNQTLAVTYEGITQEFIVKVEDYVSSLTVTPPEKLEYEYGESLDLTKGTVAIVMASGKIEDTSSMTASMVSGFNAKQEGTQTIEVEYKGMKGSFKVKVVDKVKGVSLDHEPNKITYKPGESLDVTGGTITVIKSSGIDTLVITRDMVSGYDPDKTGTQLITVTYGGYETKFIVIVEKPESTPVAEPTTRPSRRPSSHTSTTPVVEEPELPEEKPIIPEEKPTITPTPTTIPEEKPTAILGVNESSMDLNLLKIVAIVIGVIGLMILFLLFLLFLLVLLKRNVKIFVTEDDEFVLGGKDKLTKKNPKLNVDRCLDDDTYEKPVKIVLNDSISEKLDGIEIEIMYKGKKIMHKVEYQDKPYEFTLK